MQDAVDDHREKLEKLEQIMEEVGTRPVDGNDKGDEKFEAKLKQLNETIANLYEQAILNDG